METAVDVVAARIRELEAEMVELTETTDTRSREIDKTLGKLRREACDASNACRAAEGNLATVETERASCVPGSLISSSVLGAFWSVFAIRLA